MSIFNINYRGSLSEIKAPSLSEMMQQFLKGFEDPDRTPLNWRIQALTINTFQVSVT